MKRIEHIRNVLGNNIGRHMCLRCVKGRKRYVINNCILDKVYPGIFVIKVVDSCREDMKTMSFGYSDILTKTIEICLYDENAS